MIVFVFDIFLSKLYLGLTEEEEFSISTFKNVLFLSLLFECAVKRYDGIRDETVVTVKSLAFVCILPVRYAARILCRMFSILNWLM